MACDTSVFLTNMQLKRLIWKASRLAAEIRADSVYKITQHRLHKKHNLELNKDDCTAEGKIMAPSAMPGWVPKTFYYGVFTYVTTCYFSRTSVSFSIQDRQCSLTSQAGRFKLHRYHSVITHSIQNFLHSFFVSMYLNIFTTTLTIGRLGPTWQRK